MGTGSLAGLANSSWEAVVSDPVEGVWHSLYSSLYWFDNPVEVSECLENIPPISMAVSSLSPYFNWNAIH